MKKITLLLALLTVSLSFGQIVINEVDADQTGTDTQEFIELLTDNGNQSLDGFIVVLYNGNNDLSYTTVDLQGFSSDADGYFIIGGDAVAGADITLGPDNVIQNGADAVAVYQASASSFPDGTAVTSTGLIDAIVYGTNDDDDMELLNGLNETVQYNEDANNNNADTESNQRRDDGTYCTAAPTLRAASACSGCTLALSFGSVMCDAVTTGTDTVTYTIDFTGGGQETITLELDVDGTISGDDPSTDATGTITVVIDEGIDAVLSATGATCDTSIDLFAENCEPAADVATIADLRAGNLDQEYTLTGEVVLTFQLDFRNQKFIEDATGAILIDDNVNGNGNPGNITTTYNIGDGITGIRGTLTEFQGMLQFQPLEDSGPATSTGNAIEAQLVTTTQLAANPNNYEAEYVVIADATIDNSEFPNWENGEVYEMTTSNGTYNFRTSFFDVDYIGDPVPTTAQNVAGIITERNNGDYFITSRDSNDLDATLSLEDNNIEGLSIYPNPASGVVTISTALNAQKSIVIFDVTGKQVLNTEMSGNSLTVNKLSAGLYIIQITEGENTATSKLIIK